MAFDTLNLKELEKRAIIKALNISKLNVTKASKLLGISRNTLYNKMKKYSINQIKEIRM
ncbi:MAG: helix-turn-helix domain-containing protein [Peptostreptococcaceae bacterium]|nr:helix-turn-helix domain-containing protein [Peptostreptococcaceae bacterium]